MSKPYDDPELDQAVLDAVASTEPERLRNFLRPRDYEVLSHLPSASLEDKLTLLCRLGRRFAIVVYDRKKVTEKPITRERLSTILRFFKIKATRSVGTALTDWGMFIRADREIFQALNACSGYLSGNSVYLFRNYEEIASHIENLNSIVAKKRLDDSRALVIDRFLREAYRVFFSYRDEVKRYGIRPIHIPLLFLFSSHPKTWLTTHDLCFFLHYDRASRAQYVVSELVQGGIVDEIVGEDAARLYQLTAYGAFITDEIRKSLTFNA